MPLAPRKFVFCALALMTFMPAMAQDYTFGNQVTPHSATSLFRVGLFGGMSNNKMDIDVAYASDLMFSDANGYAAGINASLCPKGWFSIHAAASLVQKNWHLERNNTRVKAVYTDATNTYFSFPLDAEFSLGRIFRVCGFFGGYVGYWLSGHREGNSLSVTSLITGEEDDMYFDEDYTFNSQRDNRLDAGLTYGMALRCTVAHSFDLSFEMRWYYGLTDLQKDYMNNIMPRYNDTRCLTFGLSYWL